MNKPEHETYVELKVGKRVGLCANGVNHNIVAVVKGIQRVEQDSAIGINIGGDKFARRAINDVEAGALSGDAFVRVHDVARPQNLQSHCLVD